MHLPSTTTALTALAATASIAVLATAGTAGAGSAKVLVDLRGTGVGTHVVDDAGTAHLAGEATGKPFDGSYTATLAATDGTLPAPGVCEPAVATLDLTGTRGRFLQLEATGSVCGQWTDATYIVSQRFTGTYVVAASSSRRLVGTDGWISEVLTNRGGANIEVFDS